MARRKPVKAGRSPLHDEKEDIANAYQALALLRPPPWTIATLERLAASQNRPISYFMRHALEVGARWYEQHHAEQSTGKV
jgi:hypothetical protein